MPVYCRLPVSLSTLVLCLVFSTISLASDVALRSTSTTQYPQSQMTDMISEMESLVSDAKYEDAFLLGKDQLEQAEGNAAFDFLYGLSALETGNYGEAIFSFERILINQPDQLRTRLELARSYFLTGNLSSSKTEFASVMAANPPPEVSDNIQAFLQRISAIERQSAAHFSGYVEFSLGTDSNINSATNLNSIDLPDIGTVVLDQQARQDGDLFRGNTTYLNFHLPRTKTSFLTFSLIQSALYHNETNDFDLGNYRLSAAYHVDGEGVRYRYSTYLQQTLLEKSGFQHSAEIKAERLKLYDGGWSSQLGASIAMLRFDDDARRDTNQYILSAAINKRVNSFTHSLSSFIAFEPARKRSSVIAEDGEFNGKNTLALAYQFNFKYRDAIQAFVQTGWQLNRHHSEQPIFATQREDQRYTGAIGWRWQLNDTMTVLNELSYQSSQSNIEVFDFERTRFRLGMRYHF